MDQDIPKHLVFSKSTPKRRKRALILVVVLFLLQLCLLWPVYPIFASPEPLILGLPQSFVWVIFILLCSFIALLPFFLKDTSEEEQ